MKNLKYLFITSGVFAFVGIVMYAIVIAEKLFNDALSPDWVKTLKVIGLIAFILALVTLILCVVLVAVLDKKNAKTEKKSDEELLDKYKTNKR